VRLARVRLRDGGSVHVARAEGDGWVLLRAEGDRPAGDALREALAAGDDLREGGRAVDAGEVDLLAPVGRPSKVVAVGLNYADHARETGQQVPSTPLLFAKTPNAVVGPGEPITWRQSDSTQVDYEAELGVVMGRRASRVAAGDALSHVLGYTCCNDVSARDAQFGDVQWTRGKSFDSFCPLGPWVVTADEVPDPQALPIRCDVSGERLQDSSTSEMVFGVAELVAYISRFMTLEPGDVIATGTPWGVGFARTPPRFLGDGDEVTVTLEGIGSLTNPCRVAP
jgi:2-keto-4-pentenoate hydratase/2-oxohepta-3-ene-1,7-dioic acid hydratase in catechol pathway